MRGSKIVNMANFENLELQNDLVDENLRHYLTTYGKIKLHVLKNCQMPMLRPQPRLCRQKACSPL